MEPNQFDTDMLEFIETEKLSLDYWDNMKKWSASAIMTLPCECNYVITGKGNTIVEAVLSYIQGKTSIKTCECQTTEQGELE